MSKTETIGVIWDMDGVIADTGPYHLESWQKVFKIRGVNFTKEDFAHNFGQRNDTIIKIVLGLEISQGEVTCIAYEKETIFRELIKDKIRALPGAIKLIKSLNEYGIKIALASSAPIENIQLVIKSLGIENCFQAIVNGKDVIKGKPSPQSFLLAAKRLRIAPKRCIVIEDAIAGIAACKSAGAHCIAVTNTNSKEKLKKADLIVDSLETVTIKDLEKLVEPS